MAGLLESGKEDLEGMGAIVVMGLAHYKNSGSRDVSGVIQTGPFLRLQTLDYPNSGRYARPGPSAFDNISGK
jgi:hypothetical protein